MRFKKILTLGINDASLDRKYWTKIDDSADKRVSLPKDSPKLMEELTDTDCLLVNPFVFKVDKGIIDAAPNLKYIGVLATAFGKIDCGYAASKNIVVTNIPNYSTEAVAEFVIGAILENLR
ncbi:hypothetical protein KY329_05715, partial [Candidatus Woesearchaeota archaeon]|nr:hypothetical protein [Candidatus Woesearchaeota archaeon]